jgi:hypothetical protein
MGKALAAPHAGAQKTNASGKRALKPEAQHSHRRNDRPVCRDLWQGRDRW